MFSTLTDPFKTVRSAPPTLRGSIEAPEGIALEEGDVGSGFLNFHSIASVYFTLTMTARALSTIETETYRQQRANSRRPGLANATQNLNLSFKRSAISNTAQIEAIKPFWDCSTASIQSHLKAALDIFLCGYPSTLAKKRKVSGAHGE